MKKVMVAALILATCFAATPDLAAQQVQPLEVEDLLDSPSPAPFDPGDFSPDGRLFAYTVIDPVRQREMGPMPEWWATGISWYGYGGDVWISDLGTGETEPKPKCARLEKEYRKLTSPKVINGNPSWVSCSNAFSRALNMRALQPWRYEEPLDQWRARYFSRWMNGAR